MLDPEKFPIDMPAMPAMPYRRSYIFLICAVASLGGLLFGYDLVIISGTVPFFSAFFHLNDISTGWAVGCINLGSAIGALLAGRLSGSLGRKKLLLLCAFLFAGTGIGTGWSNHFTLFILFRMGSGVAVGAAALVCPMYIAEMAPASLRGRLVSFYQLAIVSGLLLAYLTDYLLLHAGADNWRWMFSSQSVPAGLFFFGLLFVSESPRWLIQKNRLTTAQEVLTRIGGPSYASGQIPLIRDSFNLETSAGWKSVFQKKYRQVLWIGVAIAVFSQADGQNSLFSYAPQLFRQAGMKDDAAFLQSVIIGIVNFGFTFIAIATIDSTGRKKLLLWGSALLCLDALALSAGFAFTLPPLWILGFVLAFIAIYAATLGPATWVTLSEIFPNSIRGPFMGLATLSLWISNFFTTASFPLLKTRLGLPATFGIHAGICFLYFLFIRTRVPETKGRSLEQIERSLLKSKSVYILLPLILLCSRIPLNAQPCHGRRITVSPQPDGGFTLVSPEVQSYRPGDTLLFTASHHWTHLTIDNYRGTSSCPLVLLNDGGQTKFSGTGGIEITNSSYIKLTGSGTGSRDRYGFLIEGDPLYRPTSGKGIEAHMRSRNIEISHISIHNMGFGFVCRTDNFCEDSLTYPNWVLDSISIHDCRIVGIWYEGMYIGNTSPDNAKDSYDPRPIVCSGDTVYPMPMRNGNARVYNNYVDSTGRGGIQLASASTGMSEIHHNIVKHTGLNGDTDQGTGISVGAYTHVYIHDNTVSNTFTYGIASIGGSGTGIPLRIEHNTVDSSGYLAHYNLITAENTKIDPNTEPIYKDTLSWPYAIELVTRPTHFTDSTRFHILDNKIGLYKNRQAAIQVWDDSRTMHISGNIVGRNTSLVDKKPVALWIDQTKRVFSVTQLPVK